MLIARLSIKNPLIPLMMMEINSTADWSWHFFCACSGTRAIKARLNCTFCNKMLTISIPHVMKMKFYEREGEHLKAIWGWMKVTTSSETLLWDHELSNNLSHFETDFRTNETFSVKLIQSNFFPTQMSFSMASYVRNIPTW